MEVSKRVGTLINKITVGMEMSIEERGEEHNHDSHAVCIRNRRDGPSTSRAEWYDPGHSASCAVAG